MGRALTVPRDNQPLITFGTVAHNRQIFYHVAPRAHSCWFDLNDDSAMLTNDPSPGWRVFNNNKWTTASGNHESSKKAFHSKYLGNCIGYKLVPFLYSVQLNLIMDRLPPALLPTYVKKFCADLAQTIARPLLTGTRFINVRGHALRDKAQLSFSISMRISSPKANY